MHKSEPSHAISLRPLYVTLSVKDFVNSWNKNSNASASFFYE